MTEFNNNMTAFQNELAQNVTNLISQLSSANTQLQQILSNDDQTRAEQRQAIENFRNQTGPVGFF